MTQEMTEVRGRSIRLASGAKVALFRDVRPDGHGICFTSQDGRETRLMLSGAALDALTTLWANPRGETWVVAA